jgi:hypothetical protein
MITLPVLIGGGLLAVLVLARLYFGGKSARFIGFDGFMRQLTLVRQCWLKGGVGSGKTLLAVAIAEELCRLKITLGAVSNIPTSLPIHAWRDPLPGDDSGSPRGIRGAVVIFDEAWTVADNRTFSTNPRQYGAFARKLETMWLYPSVIAIDKRMSVLSVQRQYKISLPFFPEIWAYKWTLDMGEQQDSGAFYLINPKTFYGKFDTAYVPLDDGDISNLWELTIEEMVRNAPPKQQWFRPAGSAAGAPASIGNSSRVRAISGGLAQRNASA